MAIDNPARHHLRVRRNRDYVKVFEFEGDYSAYTGRSQIRESDDDNSTLIATFTVSVGAYSGGVTPITISLTDGVTDAITQSDGYWDLVLKDGSDIDETYIEGRVQFKNVPTTLV